MPLDIEKLRLTKSEYYDVIRKVYLYASPAYPKEVIDAQLGKALWYITDWLYIASVEPQHCDLEEVLLDAGIPRPEEKHEA